MNVRLPSGYSDLYQEFASRATPERFAAARPGRDFPDPKSCLMIQCGIITPDQAGMDLLADCSFAGFQGSMSCADPLCAPYCGRDAYGIARMSYPLPIAQRIARRFEEGPISRCANWYSGPRFWGPYSDPGYDCPEPSWINQHPFLALGLAVTGVFALWRARG